MGANKGTRRRARRPAVIAGLLILLAIGAVVAVPSAAAAGSLPIVGGVSPNTGPKAGGTPVTITGANFTGATAVKFGTLTASFTVSSASAISATAPASSTTGAVNVTVTTPNGTSVVRAQDIYTYRAPAVTGVSPTSGPQAGGTVVTITGSDLTGATAVSFGTRAATSVTVSSDTQITATSPASTFAGIVDVTVTGPDGTSSAGAADRFTYLAPPRISSLSPTSGGKVGGTTVTITGSGFTGATAVKFGASAASSFTVDSATQITAISPPAALTGAVNVTVTTPNGTSAPVLGDVYTYIAPAITGVSPSSGPQGGGTIVTITGSDFTGATAVEFGTRAATSVTVNSDGQITATSPASLAAGVVNVTVTGPDGTSALTTADRFTYIAPPTISSISPTSGYTTGGTTVTITGSHFTGATAVRFGTVDASYTVDSDTQITATSPAQGAGTYDITVVGPGGTSATGLADRYKVSLVPTALTATPAIAQLSGLKLYLLNLNATLTNSVTGAPISGATITFTAGATTICSATTNDSGTATCNGSASAVSIVLSLGYTATYDTNAVYAGSSAHAALIAG